MMSTATRTPRRLRRRAGLAVAALLLAAILAFALSRLGLHRIGHALASASPGWILLALALMSLSLLARAISWHEVLRAALPRIAIPWPPVVRATMIGVMGSAVFPGRIGEPTRVLVLSRRLEGSARRLLPVLAGTVFSQTIINLLALAILATVTFTSVQLFAHEGVSGLLGVLFVPLVICLLVIAGPRLLRLAQRAPSLRISLAAAALARMLRLARQGLAAFAAPRHGVPAVLAQLLAWTLQLACYAVLLALGLQSHGGLAAAAAVLLAVNVSAVLPATPSNVGVFQAACLVVLAAYDVGAGPALAYGIILQAVEVITALALGLPALLGEGMTWREIRSGAALESNAVGGK
jgi:phosphatidylinositol alpha-mannosyltransferase